MQVKAMRMQSVPCKGMWDTFLQLLCDVEGGVAGTCGDDEVAFVVDWMILCERCRSSGRLWGVRAGGRNHRPEGPCLFWVIPEDSFWAWIRRGHQAVPFGQHIVRKRKYKYRIGVAGEFVTAKKCYAK